RRDGPRAGHLGGAPGYADGCPTGHRDRRRRPGRGPRHRNPHRRLDFTRRRALPRLGPIDRRTDGPRHGVRRRPSPGRTPLLRPADPPRLAPEAPLMTIRGHQGGARATLGAATSIGSLLFAVVVMTVAACGNEPTRQTRRA